MKKDYIRDYAIEAFRFYASINMSAYEYKEKIKKEAMEIIAKKNGTTSSGGSPTESQLIYAEKVVQEKLSEIEDISAVEKTIAEFKAQIDYDTVELIRMVYFKEPKKEIKKGEIQQRVIKACDLLNISESTAYRYLKRARTLFGHNRGLRTGKVEKINYF